MLPMSKPFTNFVGEKDLGLYSRTEQRIKRKEEAPALQGGDGRRGLCLVNLPTVHLNRHCCVVVADQASF